MRRKYALVTGTDYGLGLALAEELLSRGYFVVAARRDPKEKQIDGLQEKNKESLEIVQVDIGNDESVKAMQKKVRGLVPHLDLLINDAGILGSMDKVLGDDLDFDEMLQVINVNALGTLRVTNALFDLVVKSEGKLIVNISSEAGSIADCGRKGWFGYCMSKAANNMQSVLVQNNVRENGVRVIAVHPGHVATYMRGHLDTTAKLVPKESAAGILHVVLDRLPAGNDGVAYVDYKGDPLRW